METIRGRVAGVVGPPVWILLSRFARTSNLQTCRPTAVDVPPHGPGVRGLAHRSPSGFCDLVAHAVLGRVVMAEKPQQPADSFAARAGRAGRSQLLVPPAPQRVQQLTLPPLQRLPAARLAQPTKASAQARCGLAVDQRQEQAQRDGRGCVPPARIQRIRQHADRPPAPATQEPADPHDQIPAGKPEHLATVRAVADDPQALTRWSRRLVAHWAARWPKLVDRWKAIQVGKALDRDRESAYDRDHLVPGAARRSC